MIEQHDGRIDQLEDCIFIGLDKYHGSGFSATCNSWSANYHPIIGLLMGYISMCKGCTPIFAFERRKEARGRGRGKEGEREGRGEGREGEGEKEGSEEGKEGGGERGGVLSRLAELTIFD